ncbi:MAG: hypothetical protein ABUS79_14395 [Pseudomonadota bacterium]
MTLLLLVLAAAYVAYAAWPVIVLNAGVKDALEDAVPVLYRANLLPEPESTTGTDEVRRVLLDKLAALGVADPQTALTITRDPRIVAIEARIDAAIDLKLIGKQIPWKLRPRVETSAERVSY